MRFVFLKINSLPYTHNISRGIYYKLSSKNMRVCKASTECSSEAERGVWDAEAEISIFSIPNKDNSAKTNAWSKAKKLSC